METVDLEVLEVSLLELFLVVLLVGIIHEPLYKLKVIVTVLDSLLVWLSVEVDTLVYGALLKVGDDLSQGFVAVCVLELEHELACVVLGYVELNNFGRVTWGYLNVELGLA